MVQYLFVQHWTRNLLVLQMLLEFVHRQIHNQPLYDCDKREIYWINIFKNVRVTMKEKKHKEYWERDSIINKISARKKETNSNCIHLEWIKRESYIFGAGLFGKAIDTRVASFPVLIVP